VPDGDIDRAAERVSFGELKRNIGRTASLLCSHGIGRNDAVAVLLPAVPAIYWSILGAMAAAIVFPVNWMLEPKYVLRLIKEANVKAVIALGPTPGFQIWEALAQVAADLPSGVKIWSVPGPGGTLLPDSDLEAALDGNPEKAIWSDAVAGDNIAALVHSGGTTGLPKIVKLSHRNMSYRHWTLQLAQQLVFGEVILQDTPMFHVGGLIGRILPPFASGAGVLIPTVLGARDTLHRQLLEIRGEVSRNTTLGGADDACGAGQVAAGRYRSLVAAAEFHHRLDLAAGFGPAPL
jgi:fatty-acyl-CoA synthase